MTTSDTISYLKQVQTLQKNLLIIEELINKADQITSGLGIKNNIKAPQVENPYKKNKSGMINFIANTFVFLIVFICSMIFITPLYMIFRSFFNLFHNVNFWLVDIAISVIVAILIMLVISPLADEHAKTEWDEYNKQVNKQKERLNRESVLKNNIASKRATLKKEYNETLSILRKLYQIKENGHYVLYPKYQDIVPVSMFIEYLESRMCYSLEGHEGAYNKYEKEIRLNLIITKLDDVIDRLDDIKKNQYSLFQSLNEIKTKSNVITKELSTISNNTEITKFNSEIAAKNLEAQTMMEIYRLSMHV